MKLFDYDGHLMKALTKVMYVVGVNLLFLLCSLPVITIGASATAAYTVLLRYASGDEPDIIRTFFQSFKDCLKKATAAWLIMVMIGSSLGLNYYLLYQRQISFAGGIRVVLNVILLILVFLWIYLFPAMAYFENTLKGLFVFSLQLAVGKLGYTILLMVIHLVLTFMLVVLSEISLGVLLSSLFGFSLPAYLSSLLLQKLFQRFEEK